MQVPTILVVDDESLIRFALSKRLSAEGYRVVEADSAAGAIANASDADDNQCSRATDQAHYEASAQRTQACATRGRRLKLRDSF